MSKLTHRQARFTALTLHAAAQEPKMLKWQRPKAIAHDVVSMMFEKGRRQPAGWRTACQRRGMASNARRYVASRGTDT